MFGLFAQQVQGNPFDRPEILWGTVGLAVALLVGGAVVFAVDRWRKRLPKDTDALGELSEYREMYEHGEITQAEYAKLRAQVAERVKQTPAVPAPNPETGEQPMVNGLPRVRPAGAPPPPPPPEPEPKPWDNPRRESDPPA